MRRALPVLLLLAAWGTAGELTSVEKRVIQAAKTARESVVTVLTDQKKAWHYTGVVVARNLVLTLRKPFVDALSMPVAKISVRFPASGKTVPAEILDQDEGTNTLLLEAAGKAKVIKPRLADRAHLGMWVLMVGNSFGAGRESTPTVSLGVVSGVQKGRTGVRTLFTSTLVNPGSFGAPIVDLDGGLLGIAGVTVTPSGGQSVVMPYQRILESYREKRGPGMKALGSHIYKARRGNSLHEQFGYVMEEAARRARAVLVGVRAGAPLAGQPAPEKPAEEKKPADDGKKKPQRKGPPDPKPVPGELQAYDRSSGVLVSQDGLVVCPLRVTGWPGPTRALMVDLPGGEARKAVLLGTDWRLRLALLSVDVEKVELPERLPVAELRPGRFVLALGFPHEAPRLGSPQVTVGVVSRTGALGDLHTVIQAVQTDAGVAGGNRGGPLIDIEGRLIGVLLDVNDTNRLGYVRKKQGAYAGNAGLAFAVPMHVLDEVVPRLAKGETIRAAYFGSTGEQTADGLRLMGIKEENPAHKAGLRDGDILVELGGRKITDVLSLARAVAKFNAGEEVEAVYLRGGERKTATVKLGTRPDS